MNSGRSPERHALRIGAAASLLLLCACAHTPHRPPAAQPATPASPTTVLPRNPPDVSQIPDAVPRAEARSAFGNPPFYYVGGRRYAVLPSSTGYVERGVASWYGAEFHGLRTSTGEPYDMFAMTAAHKTLPLPCYARVTNLSNGRSVVVRINDRGPFVANRIVDLSYSAAARLDMIRNGTAFVQLEVLTPASTPPNALMPVTTLSTEAARVGVSSVPAVSSAPAPPPAPDIAPTIEVPAAPAAAPNVASGVAPSPAGAFYIQVGAYSKTQNADAAVRKLRAAGFDHAFTLAGNAHQPLLRVRIGPISSVQQFDATITRLDTLGFRDARLAQD
ncbi:MAG TPA: septal ring lytic transglycosylase RlpA family protein [Steroidobacteraceae bacterium]